jgi:hypothetical protein
MITVVAGVILCTFLPFLPGRYESFSVPLSVMAQILGMVGLLLVPIGVIWLVVEFSSRSPAKRYALGMVALGVWALVWCCVSIGALVSSGWLLAVGTLAVGMAIVLRVLRRLNTLTGTTAGRAMLTPLSLVLAPVTVFVIQLVLADPVAEFSRNRAIQNSARLIADIEQYRVTHGRYPASLISVWEDYSPSIIGIDRYHYEPNGESFNVIFEQTSLVFGTVEFVVYNPRDEQEMTSHNMDLLRRPEQLRMRRGYYAARDAGPPHWKYFLFD